MNLVGLFISTLVLLSRCDAAISYIRFSFVSSNSISSFVVSPDPGKINLSSRL